MKRGCTQCGECLNVCPVFLEFKREEYAPKGKRLLLEPLDKNYGGDSPFTWEQIRKLARLCAGCGRCQQACARKLSTADLLADGRAAHPHWSQYLWEIWIKHMGPLWPTVGFAASLVPEAVTPNFLKSSIASAKALVNKSNIAPFAKITPTAAGDRAVPVSVFAGCTANRVRPQWKEKAEALLRRWGYEIVSDTGFTCCGATMHHAGQYKAMNSMREQNAEHWRSLGRPRVVVFCASCFHGLEAYAETFFQAEEAEAWKASLCSLSALLEDPVTEPLMGQTGPLGYHQPCHWGTKDSDLPFLRKIFPGLVKGTGICCGMGGILKMSNPDLSMRIAGTCIQGFPPEAGSILTGCSGCVIQLASAVPRGHTVSHWLDCIA